MSTASSSSWHEGSPTRLHPPSYMSAAIPWSPTQLYDDDRVHHNLSQYELPIEEVPRNLLAPIVLEPQRARIETPPSYSFNRLPPNPVIYSFTSLGASSSPMVLLPPTDSPDTRPLYHISVGQDPFFPNCFVTSVVQGDSEKGPLVGSFRTIIGMELRKDNEAETVCVRECEHPLFMMFKMVPFKRLGLKHTKFSWYDSEFNSKRALIWTCSTDWPTASPVTCTTPTNPKRTLARFSPAQQLQRRDRPIQETTLTVAPDGHAYFDDILLSALLLERHRRTELFSRRSMLDFSGL